MSINFSKESFFIKILISFFILVILLPPQIAPAFSHPPSTNLRYEIQNFLLKLAYDTAKQNIEVPYLFIPGIGFGEQDLAGGGKLKAILILLPIIDKGDNVAPTSGILASALSTFISTLTSNLLSGNGENDLMSSSIKALSESLRTSYEKSGIVSFYIPYQKIGFRVIAIVWIDSKSLLSSITHTLQNSVKYGINFAFDMATESAEGAADSGFDKLYNYIANEIDNIENYVIDNVAENLLSYIDSEKVKSNTQAVPDHTEIETIQEGDQTKTIIKNYYYIEQSIKLSDLKGSQIVENIISAIESEFNKNFNLKWSDISRFKDKDNLDQTNKEYLEKLFNSIIEEIKKESPLYDTTPTRLLNSFSQTTTLVTSRSEDNIPEDEKESKKNEEKELLFEENLNKLKNIIKSKLHEVIDPIIVDPNPNPNPELNSLKVRIKEEISNMKKDIHHKIISISKEAKGKVGDELYSTLENTVGDALSSGLSKAPVVGQLYMVADAIHQVMQNVIPGFDYDVTSAKDQLILTSKNNEIINIKVGGEDEKNPLANGHVDNSAFGIVEGVVKGVMAAIANDVASPEVKKAVNMIPQIFTFEMLFRPSTQKDPNGDYSFILTPSKPGFYEVGGEITFNNVYSTIRIFDDFKGKLYDEISSSKEECSFGPLAKVMNEEISNEKLEESQGSTGNNEGKSSTLHFSAYYLCSTAIPVVDNVYFNSSHVTFKFKAVFDIGSLVRISKSGLQEKIQKIHSTTEGLKQAIKEYIETYINNIGDRITNTMSEFFRKIVDSLYDKLKKEIDDQLIKNSKDLDFGNLLIGGVLNIILEQINNNVKGFINKEITFFVSSVSDPIITTLSTYIDGIFNNIEGLENEVLISKVNDFIDCYNDFVSITLSRIRIPLTGSGGQLKIFLSSIGFLGDAIDNAGYVSVTIPNRFDVSKIGIKSIGSELVYNLTQLNKESISQMPNGWVSYEPLVVRTLSMVEPSSSKNIRIKIVTFINDNGKTLTDQIPELYARLVLDSGEVLGGEQLSSQDGSVEFQNPSDSITSGHFVYLDLYRKESSNSGTKLKFLPGIKPFASCAIFVKPGK